MNTQYYLFIGILLILLNSCSKTTVIDLPDQEIPCVFCPPDTLFKNIDTLWTAKPTAGNSFYDKGIFSEGDMVIVTGSTNTFTFVNAYSKSTGILMWERKFSQRYFSSAVLENGNLVLQSWKDILLIEVQSGTVIHDYKQAVDNVAHTFGQLLGNYYYYTRVNNNESKAWLVRSHISDFSQWETVYELNRGEETGGSRPNIESYNLWIHPETNDSIILFQHRMAFPDRVDIVAWNHRKKNILWRHNHISPIRNSSYKQIMILKDKAYFSASSVFYCFDMRTGEIIWKFDHPSGINSMLYYSPVYAESENAIILKDDGDMLFSFDADTGEVNWSFNNRGASSVSAGSPVYHNGVVYYCTAGKLFAVVAATGKVLLRESSSIDIYNFRGDLALDRDNDILYAMDGRRIYAIKTLEPN